MDELMDLSNLDVKRICEALKTRRSRELAEVISNMPSVLVKISEITKGKRNDDSSCSNEQADSPGTTSEEVEASMKLNNSQTQEMLKEEAASVIIDISKSDGADKTHTIDDVIEEVMLDVGPIPEFGNASNSFKCPLCPYSARDHWHLQRHLKRKTHHQKLEDVNKGQLLYESKLAGDGRQLLTCKYCSYVSQREERMKRHARVHSGERPYPCPHCDYRASQSSTLDRHIRTHTGDKPFQCHECNLGFGEKKSLNFHILQNHSDNNHAQYACTQCGYTTRVERYLKLHMKNHENDRPYLCDICGYAAKRVQALAKHKNSMHNPEKPTKSRKINKLTGTHEENVSIDQNAVFVTLNGQYQTVDGETVYLIQT